MKTIDFRVTFFSYWHTGSGLTSGSDLDALVIKDKEGFPYIPGKTLKGLLKAAALEMNDIEGIDYKSVPFITEFFGYFDEMVSKESESHTKGSVFFSDAVLSNSLKQQIKDNEKGNKDEPDLQEYLFDELSATAIDQNGVAKEGSLRKMQVTIPCTLYAKIYFVDDKYLDPLNKCMLWIKQLGLNRHRGLGRCKFEIINQ